MFEGSGDSKDESLDTKLEEYANTIQEKEKKMIIYSPRKGKGL